MTSAPVLRPYQASAMDRLRASLRAGKRRPLLVSPTGSGKTVMAGALVNSAVAKGSRVLFEAHRKELIDQTSDKLDRFGVEHGVIMADHWRRFPDLPVQVASIQTLARRDKPPADLIFIDEAHHARARTYERILEAYPNVPVVGLTATPWRNDGKGLGELFDDLIVAAKPSELLAEGFLVPFGGFSFEMPDLSGVHLRGSDYDEHELELVCNQTRIVGGIVQQWLEHAGGVRTIAFAINIAHSQNIVAQFRAAGVAAEHLDGHTPKTEREAILARLESGETRVVSNVAVLTEGWDCPSAACCILARPSRSLVVYLQEVGRVLRPHPESGKVRALIHDHAGALLTHGLPDEDRDYSLTSDVKRQREAQAPAIVQCHQCARVYAASLEACPECGTENPRVVAPEAKAAGGSERLIEEVEGRKLAIDEIRRLRALPAPAKASEYKRLLQVAQRKSYQVGWAAHQYRATFGVWPRFKNGVLEEAQPAARPVIDLDKLRRLKAVARLDEGAYGSAQAGGAA